MREELVYHEDSETDCMTIGINTLYLIPNQVGGTEYYARSIIDAFDAYDSNDSFVLFCNKENARSFSHLSKKFTVVVAPIFAQNRVVRILYEQLLFPFLVLKNKCDVIYSPGYIGPALVPGIKKVVTVHDINWKDHPEDFSFVSFWATKLFTEFSMFFANTLIVSSDFAKDRLTHHFPQYADKTTVIWPGIEDGFKTAVKTARQPSLKNYVLTVSAFYPHKKIPYELSLFAELTRLPKYKDLSLVLIGNNGNDNQKVLSMISESPNVHYFPKVSYTELMSYYAHAAVVIQPSVYEGFGYPVYEAVTAGKQVVIGKKRMYHEEIQDYLSELTFTLQEDIKVLADALKQSKKKVTLPKIFSYQKVIKNLQDIFYEK